MLLDVRIKEDWGKVINIFGPSGAGKTSILRMLAGLMMPDQGTIEVRGNTWFHSGNHISLRPQERRLGFIFQDYALFPNMTVKENLLYALDKGQSKSIVDELIDLIELGPLQNRYPKTLSGGQQQRVALARSVVRKPDLLLLDEPLSALDQSMRKKLQRYILDLHTKYNLTTMLVSHDMDEVFKMADVVYKIDEGKIIQFGTTEEVFAISNQNKQHSFVGTVLEIGKDDAGEYIRISNKKQVELLHYQKLPQVPLSLGDHVCITTHTEITSIEKINL